MIGIKRYSISRRLFWFRGVFLTMVVWGIQSDASPSSMQFREGKQRNTRAVNGLDENIHHAGTMQLQEIAEAIEGGNDTTTPTSDPTSFAARNILGQNIRYHSSIQTPIYLETETPRMSPLTLAPTTEITPELTFSPEYTVNDVPTTFNPTTATFNPTTVTLNPTIATLNPTVATSNPTIATLNPTVATSNPTIATLNPTMATFNPTEATLNPTMATSNPTIATLNPTMATSNPTMATSNPTIATLNPTTVTFNPTTVTDRPTLNPPGTMVLSYQNVAGFCSGAPNGVGCANESPDNASSGNPNDIVNCYDVTIFGVEVPFSLDSIRVWIGDSTTLTPDLRVKVWVGNPGGGPISTRLLYSKEVFDYSVGENKFDLNMVGMLQTNICVGVTALSTNAGLRIQTDNGGAGEASFLRSPECGVDEFISLSNVGLTNDFCIEALVRYGDALQR